MPKDNLHLFNLSDYNFHLPPELIATHPVEPRDSSKLLLLHRESGKLQDASFCNIIDFLNEGDTLVVNETKVIPARLYGNKDTGARVEILLLKRVGEYWEAITRPAKRLKTGAIVRFAPSDTYIEVVEELETAGARLLKFHNVENEIDFINRMGQMPLPPYIDRPVNQMDKENYQTIYAKQMGSVAAPTAGLHFTDDLLESIIQKGVNIAKIVLHVGLGTFRPVNSQDIRNHVMHRESYYISKETADLLNDTKAKGNNIIAVGTTVARTLETVYNIHGQFSACQGETDIFIYPGYEFKAIDRLITNFHLPFSSLIMLVSAFAGYDNIMNAYSYAVENKYRFFSYGDAMFII